MSHLSPNQRIVGVLAPVFALRGSKDLGIGDTLALREFATWAASHDLHVVQILPINETSADNSPYNIISSMAIDPMTIATFPLELPDLRKSDFEQITKDFDLKAMNAGPVHYAEVKKLKRALLEAAFSTFREKAGEDRHLAFDEFNRQHEDWLGSYAIYRALVSLHGESEVFSHWPSEQQSMLAARNWIESLPEHQRYPIEHLANFHRYVQWIAFSQWHAVREHCKKLDVSLMGDVPVGVSVYSCDVWSEPEVFDLTRSSGAPPEKVFKSDPFTEKWGQNWGFPLYNWFAMSHDNFSWWRRRFQAMVSIFDLIRIDHALGFFRIYSFPWRPEKNIEFLNLTEEEVKAFTGGQLPGFLPCDDSTPENQARNCRHGEVLFKIMLEEIPAPRLIAEDLGTVPPYVRPVLERLKIPGFKIPQWERESNTTFISGKNYHRLSLATYATHDHPPVHTFWNSWFELTKSSDLKIAADAMAEMNALLAFCDEPPLDLPRPFDNEIHAITMRGLLASNSWLAIPMITDILGTEDRFNFPGAIHDQNWTARLNTPVACLDEKFKLQLKLLRKTIVQTGRMMK